MEELGNDYARALVARTARTCAEMNDDGADIDFVAHGMSTRDQAIVMVHAKTIRNIVDQLRAAGWMPAFCAQPGREYLALTLFGRVVTVRLTDEGFKGSKSLRRVHPLYIKNRIEQ